MKEPKKSVEKEYVKEVEHRVTTLHLFLAAVVAVMILFVQFQIFTLNDVVKSEAAPQQSAQSTNLAGKSGVINAQTSQAGSSMQTAQTTSAASQLSASTIIGPQINPDGKTTKLVEWPTISLSERKPATGDAMQDAINTVVPTGTPFYVTSGQGSEIAQGASFDNPIESQKVWAKLEGNKRVGATSKLELSPEQEQRYNKLVSIFTCDYCCGGPSSVTRITQCGCMHASAWRGMARFFVKYYGDKKDEEILGEMTKWKAAFYPKGMIEDYLVFNGQMPAAQLKHGGSVGIQQQFAGKGGTTAVTSIDNLPGMVGGC